MSLVSEVVATSANLAVTVLAAGLAVLSAYLILLTLFATFRRQYAPPAGPGKRRFAVLVPAHNEELVIARLLRSLSAVEYPRDLVDVCVVADNCDDRTAEIATAHGARVFERTSTHDRAKGFALRWLLQQLRSEGRMHDAVVVLDADTIASPDLLTRLDARLEAGSQVVQVYYTVLNANASAVAGVRFAALAAVHYLRPLGRSALGLSCGLKGNGMCFASTILDRFSWNWFTLAEDVEFHLALVREGVRVDFAWETSVQAEMPVTLAQARSQNARWEQGRLQLLRAYVPSLVLDGLRQRSFLKLDAAIEQILPPLSVPFALGGACFGASLALGSEASAILAGVSLIAQIVYVAAGLALVRAPAQAYVALSTAPIYIAWKVTLYAQALVSGRVNAWVRTTRISTAQ